MTAWRPDDALVAHLYRQAEAARWSVDTAVFTDALERSARKALATAPRAAELARYLGGLHLADLALACGCAAGHEGAWDAFIREQRPVLYRAAAAIAPDGGARELADSLYAELYGLSERDGRRQSLFDYFHGRSSLATWLRAVLAQRHVDQVRRGRRFDPLPEDVETAPPRHSAAAADTGGLLRYARLMQRTIADAVRALPARDRLRLAWYYVQELSLAQIGRALGEHEATASRHLMRARRSIRTDVERRLREDERMTDAEIRDCFAAIVADPGPLDVTDLVGGAAERKDPDPPRSKERTEGASA